MMSEPIVLTGWLAGLSLFVALLGVGPLIAARPPVVLPPAPLAPDPYREPAPGGVASTTRDGRGVLGGVLGVIYLLSAPGALVLTVLRWLSWDAETIDDTAGTLILLACAPVGLFVGVALILSGSRMGAGTPTTRINAAALALFAAYLWATGLFVLLESFGAIGVCIALAAFAALAGATVYAFVVRPIPIDASEARRARFRVVGSDATVGVFAILGSACVLWIAGELGDRLSNHRSAEEDAFCLAMELPMLGVGLWLGLAALVALGAAVVVARRPLSA